jgi:hypothetical protein
MFRLLVNRIIGQYRPNLLQNKSQLYYIILAGIVLQYIRCSSLVLPQYYNSATRLSLDGGLHSAAACRRPMGRGM